MTMSYLCFVLHGLLFAVSALGHGGHENKTKPFDLIEYVDPLIGSTAGGHVFAGATLPFGMAKAVPDVRGENQAGFSPDGTKIRGFSHMHDSGTGGAQSLGNFPLYPINCPKDQVDLKECIENREVHYVNGSIVAKLGYFALELETGIRAEMTTTNRTALYRFTFDQSGNASYKDVNPLIVLTLDSLPQPARGATITRNNSTGRITGGGTFTPSFGSGSFTLFFCADFKGAPLNRSGIFDDSTHVDFPATENSDFPRGAVNQFNATSKEDMTILARVGVSFISEEQACKTAEKELADFDFEATVHAAQDAWRKKLSVVQISDDDGVSESFRTVFWSGLSRSFHSPQDYTDENPLWESDEPYYDSFYCIWDSYRAQHPLLTLLDPQSNALMIRALIDIYRHEGYLPDCRMSLCKGWTQGGSNADVVLADAFVKGMYDKTIYNIDWIDGYKAVVKDAEEEASSWDLEGRGGLESWKKFGFIPIDDVDTLGFGPHTRSISRTVEYAYDDFAVAQIARGLSLITPNITNATLDAYNKDWKKYTKRAGNWKNLLKLNQTTEMPETKADSGFLGVMQPRHFDGSWAYQHPLLCSAILEPLACFLTFEGHETYEGSAWEYTMYTPADTAELIRLLGTKENFVKRLDFLHETGMLYVGDEQAFLLVFLYHYAGRPGLSAKRAHAYIPSQFNDTWNGIPGNDDSGAMGAFASLTMMGIFPNAGQNLYFITPPFFREVSIRNPITGNTATIRNRNFDAAYKNIYIQSATLDGANYTKSWIDHAFFLDGGVLELVLGPKESRWGTADEDLPPSLSTFGINNGTWDDSNPSRAVRAGRDSSHGRRWFGSWVLWQFALLVVAVAVIVSAGFLGFFVWRKVQARNREAVYQKLEGGAGSREELQDLDEAGRMIPAQASDSARASDDGATPYRDTTDGGPAERDGLVEREPGWVSTEAHSDDDK